MIHNVVNKNGFRFGYLTSFAQKYQKVSTASIVAGFFGHLLKT